MINVYVSINDDANIIRLVGHAGYAKEGEDIVCAAVSILTDTLCECLRVAELNGKCIIRKMNMDKGYIDIEYIDKGVKDIVHFFITGINLISEEYPEYINVL